MTETTTDRWSRWLSERRFGGDAGRRRTMLNHVAAIRDRVLAAGAIEAGDTVLDLGCGDGLLGFGALPFVGGEGAVIFSDVSRANLEQCRATAARLGVIHRCRFVRASAADLGAIPDSSVDVVVIRSVLIYVAEKRRAFDECFRVLRPGGRLSLFEPVARHFGYPPPPGRFGWQTLYDVRPVAAAAAKVQRLYTGVRSQTSPMMDFDEHDLTRFAQRAGFAGITLDLEATRRPAAPVRDWEAKWRSSPNPLAPTFAEAVDLALDPEEAATFIAHLRPLMERGEGERRSAAAYLRATKPGGPP